MNNQNDLIIISAARTPFSKFNPAMAVGHPLGVSAAWNPMHPAYELNRRGGHLRRPGPRRGDHPEGIKVIFGARRSSSRKGDWSETFPPRRSPRPLSQ